MIDYRLPAAPYTVEQGLRCILHSVHTHRVAVAQPSKVYYTSCTVCTVETLHTRQDAGSTVQQGLLCTVHTVEQGLAFTETRQVGSRTIFREVLCTQAQQSPG